MQGSISISRPRTQLNPITRGLAVLRKYGANAHLWLPGIGKINGSDIGNYLDSAGTTTMSVDNPVGLVLDQMYGQGALGPNLATVTSAVMTGAVEYTPITGPAATVGSVYQVSYTYNATSGAAQASIGGVALPAINGPASGSYSTFITAITTAAPTMYSNGAVGSISNYSVRQVLGIPASQATTANKPTLRRGVVNLFSYSNAFTSAAWATVGSPVLTTGQKDPFGGNGGTLYARTTTGSTLLSNGYSKSAAVLPFTSFFVVSAGTGRYFALRTQGGYPARADVVFDLQAGTVFAAPAAFSGFSGASASMAPLSNGFWLVCLSVTTDASTSVVAFVSPSSNGIVVDGKDSASNSTCYVYAGGLAAGTLTAQQILQCGGIPLTTTAAASSSAGNWLFGFTGGSQSLSFPQNLYSTADDHVVVQGAVAGNASTTLPSFAVGVGQSRFPVLYVGAGGYLTASWRDDAGAGVDAISPSLVISGESYVVTARKIGATGYIRKNGNSTSVSITGLGTTTITSAFIGASPSGSWVGSVYPTVVIKGTVSDADLLAIERMVGVLTGPTGVTF